MLLYKIWCKIFLWFYFVLVSQWKIFLPILKICKLCVYENICKNNLHVSYEKNSLICVFKKSFFKCFYFRQFCKQWFFLGTCLTKYQKCECVYLKNVMQQKCVLCFNGCPKFFKMFLTILTCKKHSMIFSHWKLTDYSFQNQILSQFPKSQFLAILKSL